MDKFFLHRSFMIQIHMQISHGGVDIPMSQSVFNIGNGFSAAKHIHGSKVTKAVSRVDVLEMFLRQHQLQIFLAEPLDTGSCQ